MKITLIICSILLSLSAFSQSALVDRLKKGQSQHIVVYGTSLSSRGCGQAWMKPVTDYLHQEYGEGLVTYTLAGKGGMWSSWAVKNLEDSVIAKKPDAVFIEFGINDAFDDYQTPVAVARLNLEYMIDRVRLYSSTGEIFIQIMNMPIGKSAKLRPHLSDYYEMYREVAKDKKVLLIDHYPQWSDILKQGEEVFKTYVPDGIHHNDKGGREIIAPTIIQRITGKAAY